MTGHEDLEAHLKHGHTSPKKDSDLEWEVSLLARSCEHVRIIYSWFIMVSFPYVVDQKGVQFLHSTWSSKGLAGESICVTNISTQVYRYTKRTKHIYSVHTRLLCLAVYTRHIQYTAQAQSILFQLEAVGVNES